MSFFGTQLVIDLGPTFFAIAIPAVIFAGISKGGFGSGASFAAAPILALVIPPAMSLGILLPLLMLMDLTALRPYWRRWSFRDAWLVILGAVPGIVLGVMLLQRADPDILRFLIGFIAIAFVAWQMARARGLVPMPKRALGPAAGVSTGAVAGFTSFVSHAGGPPVAVYLLARGMDKTTYQATTVLVFWVINIFKAVPYSVLGVFTVQTLLVDLYLAPFAVLGTWLGVKAHHMVPERLFFAITYVLLVAAGSKLIWDGLT